MRAVRLTIDTLGGVYELGRLAVLTGFRFRGRYWQWRVHTAFGSVRPARGEALRQVLEYARWVYRTRRGR